MPRVLITAGALSAALSVALGAFAAHALKSHMPLEILVVFQTGVQYQFYHSLGLILVGIVAQHYQRSILLSAAGLLMAVGILLFSGSLYALSTTGIRSLGIITPIGGVAFIAAWLLLAFGVWRSHGVKP
ncbi:MAG: DUF423 domain-containing protein [Deltaproteobacteria bacterium]|jgi:uncharacterized membrane protein YgdD (TMEM256/DUF423 family)|nr:DUF423 domain-containing protein [Deltaproteobacteria bacterium]